MWAISVTVYHLWWLNKSSHRSLVSRRLQKVDKLIGDCALHHWLSVDNSNLNIVFRDIHNQEEHYYKWVLVFITYDGYVYVTYHWQSPMRFKQLILNVHGHACHQITRHHTSFFLWPAYDVLDSTRILEAYVHTLMCSHSIFRLSFSSLTDPLYLFLTAVSSNDLSTWP